MSSKNRINEYVNKVFEDVVSKLNNYHKKLDLSKIFDLSKIPAENLKQQYYDISLVNATPGFGSPIFKGNDKKYITENDKRIIPLEQVKRELSFKYALQDWQIKIIRAGHNIQICVCIANFNQGIKEIINDFSRMGYFLSHTDDSVDYFNQLWKKMQFEPLYQNDEKSEILSHGDLFHITPNYNLENILSNGLTPRSDNCMFNYPNRIYFFIGNTPIIEMEHLGFRLCQVNKDPRNDGKYTFLRISADKIKDKVSLYYDPNFEYGVFCDTSIPADCIKVYNTINYGS